MRYYRTHLRGTRHGGVTPTIDYERTREDLADGQPLRSYPVSDFAGLAQAMGEGPVHVLDTRRADERAQGCAAPSTSPAARTGYQHRRSPQDTVWVYCGSGYRSSTAAFALDRPGRIGAR